MKIIPIAFDSLGTRSMATFVETGDCKIFIDPAVALAPRRYNLPPHKIEIERQNQHWKKIIKYAQRSDIIILTHYHYDHHNPEYPELYKDKIVFIKDPENNINKSQRSRARYFLKKLNNLPKEINISEEIKTYTSGGTKIVFSDAVFHGTNPRLGYVTEVSIEEGIEKFLFTSDVEGPAVDAQLDFILRENPDIIFADGPMTYMLGFRYSQENLNKSLTNIKRILKETKVKNFVLDHHLARDIRWREKLNPVFEVGCGIQSAANFIGLKDDLLEARRRELYKG